MRTIEKLYKYYICEVCDAQYDSEDKAKVCESSHVWNIEMVDLKRNASGKIASWSEKDGRRYPYQILVRFDNNEVVTYKKHEGMFGL